MFVRLSSSVLDQCDGRQTNASSKTMVFIERSPKRHSLEKNLLGKFTLGKIRESEHLYVHCV